MKFHYFVRYEDVLGRMKEHDFWTDNILGELADYPPLKTGSLVSVERGSPVL